MSSAIAAPATHQDWKQQFQQVSDAYLDQVYFHYAPTQGTLAGYHQYDAQMENYARANIDAETAALKTFAKRVEAIPGDRTALDETTRGDRAMVLGNIRSTLLTLQTIRPWEKDADNYSSACANGAFALMERTFASPDDRLRSLVAREKQMPALPANARVNPKNPPRIYTQIAIEQLPGIVSFFEHDVPPPLPTPKTPPSRRSLRAPTPPSSPPSSLISTGSGPICSHAPTATFASAPTPFVKNSNPMSCLRPSAAPVIPLISITRWASLRY